VCGSVVLPFERTCHLFEFASSICIFLNLHVKRLARSANLIINQDLKLPFLHIIMLTLTREEEEDRRNGVWTKPKCCLACKLHQGFYFGLIKRIDDASHRLNAQRSTLNTTFIFWETDLWVSL
jgi:hypothetical protein